MGTAKREPGEPRPKSTTGSGRWTKYEEKAPDASISWDEVSHGPIIEMIFAVTRNGDAVLMGATRDGGALVLTICSGDKRIKFYASTVQEMETHLENVRHTADNP